MPIGSTSGSPPTSPPPLPLSSPPASPQLTKKMEATAKVASNPAEVPSTIGTLAKAEEFIKSSLDKAKTTEYEEYLGQEKLLISIKRDDNEGMKELVGLMAGAHFLKAKSELADGKEKSLALQQGIKAIINGEIEKGRAHFDINAPIGYKNLSLLMCAAHFNLSDVALFLIDQDGIDINACDDEKRTALTRAVCNNAEEVARKLIENGANPHEKDIYEQTPAMKGAATGSPQAFNAILKEAEKATRFEKKRDPSIPFEATTLGKTLYAQSQQLWTVMHYAANTESPEVMEMVLGIPGRVDEMDKPLHMAETRDMVKLLQQEEKTGRAPLAIAAANGKAGPIGAIMHFVMENAPTQTGNILSATDNYNHRGLYDAVRYGHADAVAVLRKYGANSWVGSSTEETPYVAANRLYEEEVRVLSLARKYLNSPSGVADSKELSRIDIVTNVIDQHLDPSIRNKVMRRVTVKAMAQNKYEQVWNAINAPSTGVGPSTMEKTVLA